MAGPLLEVTGLSKRFGGFVALDGIDLTVAEGERVGLIGPNGSGKSTLVNCICGTLVNETGTVRFDGKAVDGLLTHERTRRGMARSFQLPRPFATLTVADNLRVPLLYTVNARPGRALSPAALDARCAELLQLVALADKATQFPRDLTQVEMRKLELARAMAAEPKLLIADESMAGLSQSEVKDIVTLLIRLNERGVTIILIEHIMSAVMSFSQRLAVLVSGRKIADGNPTDVVRNPEVEKAYTRARELCQQLGQTAQLFPTLYGLWGFYLVRGELPTTRELGEQLLSLAQREQDPALLLDAHRALGFTLYHLGEFAPAREHAEQAIALYAPQRRGVSAYNPGVSALSLAALALWHLGYPDQALKRSHEALTLAQELSHPFSLVYALGYAAGFHQLRREGQAVKERAEAARVLANVGDGVFLVDRVGIVRLWNAAAEAITGLPAGAVLGRPAIEAIPGWRAVVEHIPVAASPELHNTESVPIETPGGELPPGENESYVADVPLDFSVRPLEEAIPAYVDWLRSATQSRARA